MQKFFEILMFKTYLQCSDKITLNEPSYQTAKSVFVHQLIILEIVPLLSEFLLLAVWQLAAFKVICHKTLGYIWVG